MVISDEKKILLQMTIIDDQKKFSISFIDNQTTF